jgi:uncharacterized protein YdhG (YjbR/CyaY superfamily)
MATRAKTIDEYLSTVPDSVRPVLQQIRRTIAALAPEAAEAISYDLPTFKLKGRNLIHFGAWKDHIGIYPVPSGTDSFNEELAPYVKGKGTVQFPLHKPIPYDLLKKMVALRIEDVEKKQAGYRKRS